MDRILHGLNDNQKAAVTSSAKTLQVLAPPGSGKTRTLTSRTAYLIEHGFAPQNLIVCTFTNKSAREIRERISAFLGEKVARRINLGTFHSIARRYLATDGKLIGLDPNFGIADTADTNAIITRIIKRLKVTITPNQAKGRISKLKSQNTSAEQFAATTKHAEQQEFAQVYSEYEEHLQVSSLLDFDDLLLRCCELLRQHPAVSRNVEAVLVDEFQDTNTVQLELMELFAHHRQSCTIVADPDQSIYGWRNAEIKNLKIMQQRWPDTVVINLEENYRSSGAILIAAQEVIEQDKARPQKCLIPTFSVGLRPVLRRLPTAAAEAIWTVAEIKRSSALSAGLLEWGDYAILLRSASLSRLIESELGKAGIPYKMVGGHRFFDRIEVKLVLDYLRVISHPTHNDALARIVNVPARGVGDKTQQLLLEEADEVKQPLWNIIRDLVQGRRRARTTVSKQAETGLHAFFNLILMAQKKLRSTDQKVETLADFLTYLIRKIGLEAHLRNLNKKEPEEFDTRWANVQEMVAQAVEFSAAENTATEVSDDFDDADTTDTGPSLVEDALNKFLANVALATDATVNESDGTLKSQVTISTIHAAKGLEWPAVFIPSAYEGSIPHSRAEDNDEERRLLYVAMTRAQSMLCLSCPLKNSQREKTTLSPFLTEPNMTAYFDRRGPILGYEEVKEMSITLRRMSPTPKAVNAALCTLEYPRDNQFPTRGEDDSEEHHSWEMGANIDEASWEAKRKRPRSFNNGFETGRKVFEKKTAIVDVSLTSTMHNTQAFSTASATLQVGFTSAANLKIVDMAVVKEETTVSKKRKAVVAEPPTKSTQGSLKSFFTQTTQSSTSAKIFPAEVTTARPAPLKEISNTVEHRVIGTNHGNIMKSILPANAATTTKPAAEQTASTIIKPASILHTTSIAQVHKVPPQRKTLGIRRSMNGWPARSQVNAPNGPNR